MLATVFLSYLGFFLTSTVLGGPCPIDFVAYKKQGCFYYRGYEGDIVSRDEAKIGCLNKQGSTLASVDDADQELWLVNDYMVKNDSSRWETSWIGLVRLESRRSDWRWEDNSSSTYTHWGPGEPNDWGGMEACTMILLKWFPNGTNAFSWNDAVCEPPSNYVRNLAHTKASGYFCRLPYKEEPFDVIGGQRQDQPDPAVFSTNVGLAVSVVILLVAILSVIGYVTWTYRRMILSKLPYLTTKSASTEDLHVDHE